MNPIESLAERRAALAKRIERRRALLRADETEIAEIDTAIRVFEKYVVDEVGRQIQEEAESREAESAAPIRDAARVPVPTIDDQKASTGVVTVTDHFRLTPPDSQPMTRKQRVFVATPIGRENGVGPKELTDLVNEKFGTMLKPNHVRPLIWGLAKEGEVNTEGGIYWRSDPKDAGSGSSEADVAQPPDSMGSPPASVSRVNPATNSGLRPR